MISKKCCDMKLNESFAGDYKHTQFAPKISVVLPSFRAANYISKAIDSIQAQTYTDWELLVINDKDSDDGTVELVNMYAQKDSRIKLIQAKKRLGLAESLNLGIREARGEFIARIDADDTSAPERFAKQVAYMDEHPEIGILGSWQRHYGKSDWVHQAAIEPELQRCELLFWCDLCHSTLMLRRRMFIENTLFYDAQAQAEDYELWTRAMDYMKIANLPEVLGDYREDTGITGGKILDLAEESGRIFARILKRSLGISLSADEYRLFNGWRNPLSANCDERAKELEVIKNVIKIIWKKNKEIGYFNPKYLLQVLAAKYYWLKDNEDWKRDYSYISDINDVINRDRVTDYKKPCTCMGLVSVVMTVFGLKEYMAEAIQSILDQTYCCLELIVVVEYGADMKVVETLLEFAHKDSRMRLYFNESRLGLAESLNRGIREARGKYIARMDDDDVSMPQRLEHQVEFLEAHPEIGLCGTLQESVTPDGINVTYAPAEPEMLKAEMLFGCQLSHTSVMFRRLLFIENDWFYDGSKLAEDYDLWMRILDKTGMSNINEPLVKHRFGFGNISLEKGNKLSEEFAIRIRHNIEHFLNVDCSSYSTEAFCSWRRFPSGLAEGQLVNLLLEEMEILQRMDEANRNCGFADRNAFVSMLMRRFRWFYYETARQTGMWEMFWLVKKYRIQSSLTFRENIVACFSFIGQMDTSCEETSLMLKNLLSLPKGSRIVIYGLGDSYQRMLEKWGNQAITSNYNVLGAMDAKAKTKELSMVDFAQLEDMAYDRILISSGKYFHEIRNTLINEGIPKEKIGMMDQMWLTMPKKIRIVFVFQVPSFWPSWESLYNECLHDSRFEVRLVWIEDISYGDKAQMQNAREFLEEKGLSYEIFSPQKMLEYRPHYMVYQTPYDKGHRPLDFWTMRYKRQGARIVYVPYGIEISDTAESRYKHFTLPPVLNAFRIYVISEAMREEYRKHCTNVGAVRALGLPRFDAFAHKERFPLPQELQERIGGRRIILWKSHFPKVFKSGSQKLQATPDMEEFLKFITYIREHEELFFIFMPHPKFTDSTIEPELREKAVSLLDELRYCTNVYVDQADDYRVTLMHADAVMIDRSAVMVEVAALKCPVLYLYNEAYKEPMTPPIQKLLDSYESGCRAEEMARFCDMVQDEEKARQMAKRIAADECLPMLDGMIGRRIKEDLWQSAQEEMKCPARMIDGDTSLVIFGVGDIGDYCARHLEGYESGHIVAYTDNAKGKQGSSMNGVPVVAPKELQTLSYDFVVIATERYYYAIYHQLVDELQIPSEKVMNYDEYLMACMYRD